MAASGQIHLSADNRICRGERNSSSIWWTLGDGFQTQLPDRYNADSAAPRSRNWQPNTRQAGRCGSSPPSSVSTQRLCAESCTELA